MTRKLARFRIPGMAMINLTQGKWQLNFMNAFIRFKISKIVHCQEYQLINFQPT